VLEISGSVPPDHFARAYEEATSERQQPMYFRLGGGTIKGVSKPGEIVWSRVFVQHGKLNVDIGRGRALRLPDSEVERRWSITTPQWPLMNAVLYAVSRDHFMARHKSNHIQVAYAPDGETARSVLASKAAAVAELGITVNFCGECGFSMS